MPNATHPPVDSTGVINTRGLSKQYNGLFALKSLDLSVPEHSIFGFLGPNGAGKTTAIKLLLGLARPSGGSGTVFGNDIVHDSLEIRRRVGYLAQAPRFYEHMTGRETLRFKARFTYSGPKAAIENRIAETLELVGLADKADRPIRGFSGGERQRLGIAQAQVTGPDLLILDEPAASLDPMGRRDVLEVMDRLREQTTIFYSTHILDDVQRVSDTVAILDRGALVAQAPIEELLAGSEGTVYTVTLEGDTRQAHARVLEQAWVSDIRVRSRNGHTNWQISVTDDGAARTHLLDLIAGDRQCSVTGFLRKKHDLEEVFVDLVEGGERHVRQ